MYTLFTNEPSMAGFRLEDMEIFNWGTFDKDVYKISPSGNNSLLTGANGSGKTTYIDALLTLLVPIKKYRFYNRSSGTDKKNDRTEESYVLGAYGLTQEEGKLSSTTQYLRPAKKNVYSILIACFSNETLQPVTLFQVRWFYNNELKRVYGICRKKLNIHEDFSSIDAKGDWKKVLKRKYQEVGTKLGIEFFETGKKYGERLVKYFGMRSDKALSLFNQTVGIKVLGNLDSFIRTNMLEPREAEEEFFNLKENYETLLQAHRQIEKASEQAKQLTPIRDLADQMADTEQNLKEMETLKETGEIYLNHRQRKLLTEAIEKEERNLKALEEKINSLKHRLDDLDKQKMSLSVAIENDETGRRFKEIERELQHREKERNERKTRHNKYNQLAVLLGLQETPDETRFKESMETAIRLQANNNEDTHRVDEQIFDTRSSKQDEEKRYKAIEADVLQLLKQKSKITGRSAEIRDEIVAHVKAAQDEIPFIGELIKVKENCREWESAIERLLHNFALRLLVPDKYYKQVNRYVNENNLRGRIVYHRVKEESFLNNLVSRPPHLVLEKLAIKKTVYHDWLEHQMLNYYNYICVDHVSEIQKHQRAITMQGLIKNKGHHQKDDRREVVSRENYVLGWDNKEKIRILKKKGREISLLIKEKEDQLKKLNAQSERLKTRGQNLHKFTDYDSFNEIDWQSAAKEIQRLEEEKKRLEDTSDHIKQLQRELATVKSEIKKLEKEHEITIENRANSKSAINDYTGKRKECARLLEDPPFSPEEQTERFMQFEEKFASFLENLSLPVFEGISKALEKEQGQEKDKLEKQAQNLTHRLSGKMVKFKNPDSEITDRFPDWRADSLKLPDDPQYVGEYVELLEKIEKEDLPSFRRKFAEYLSTTMINKIAGFNQFLEEGVEMIEESIAALNKSLYRISFKRTPSTYIQLNCPNNHDVAVREFRKMLKGAIPNVERLHSDQGDKYRKEIFRQIQELIEKLDSDENWRKKVIDVRNWKSYYAQEYYRENNEPMKVYKDTGILSGGEKAQLTYTILGSAIAYQFGIKQSGREAGSFRFIAVDETFSNQDDERATYLMDLCKQLHLQLLVVTPSDKIHIVEPYISYVHYVRREANRESILYDMPIKQFQEERHRLEAAGDSAIKN